MTDTILTLPSESLFIQCVPGHPQRKRPYKGHGGDHSSSARYRFAYVGEAVQRQHRG